MIKCGNSIIAAFAARGFRRTYGTGKSLSFVSHIDCSMQPLIRVLLSAIAIAANSGQSISAENEVIKAEVIAQHVPKAANSAIKTLVASVTIESIAGDGASIFQTHNQYFRRQDGLLVTRTTMSGSGRSKMSSEVQTLSLCGLIDLTAQSGLAIQTPLVMTIPLGKILVPLESVNFHEHEGYSQIASFQTNATSICNPKPGVGFTYATAMESWSKTSGLFGGMRKQKNVVEYQCMPDVKVQRANDIHSSLNGSALAVQCETPSESPIQVRVGYVYLIDERLYIEVSRKSAVQNSQTKILAVEYGI